MEIIKEINNFYALMENSWSGAIDTLKDVEEAGKQEELMELLEETFACGNIPTETDVNDFIWFDRDYIYKSLGLDENGELPKEEEEDDDDEEEEY